MICSLMAAVLSRMAAARRAAPWLYGSVSVSGHAGEGGEYVPVPAHDDLGRGAFGVGQFEERLALGDGGGGGAVGEEVVEEGGLVSATHALDPDVVGAVVGFQRVGKGRTEGSLSMV